MTESIGVAIVGGLPALIATLWNIWKSSQIHELVNSKMTAALKRIDELERLLKMEKEKAGDMTPTPKADPPIQSK